MPLIQTIQQDLIVAMKARDTEKTTMLRSLSAAIKNAQIEKQAELTDEEVQQVIQKQVKQLKDALADFEKAARTDLIDKTNAEIGVLCAYLPEPMNEDELKAAVTDVIRDMDATNMADMGKVMGAVMQRVGTRADGGTVKQIVSTLLQSS